MLSLGHHSEQLGYIQSSATASVSANATFHFYEPSQPTSAWAWLLFDNKNSHGCISVLLSFV